ncbi:hypothetical protein [Dyella acidisoli]|uniref:Avirulence protein n=1 Tax=Dyella acidisoli TaxID=1867834 RepID=A0ABQ5XRJ9_9GAMM|nr:hypothetical protein [Dyella acidisoli]GLQ94364.1 hypothetical protein GCM10007901_33160 [Dyella acidisoli]
MLIGPDGGSPVRSAPPQPVPTPTQLTQETPAQATAAVQNMTPQDVQTFKSDVSTMSATDRRNVANQLVTKLPITQLLTLEPAFDQDEIKNAIHSHGTPALQSEYEIAQIDGNPTLKSGLAKLGLTSDQVARASDATRPILLDAAQAAAANQYDKALGDLQSAGTKASGELVTNAYAHLVSQDSQLPAPIKAILSDPDVVAQLQSSGSDALNKLSNGDFSGAVQSLTSKSPELAQKIVNAIGKQLPTGLAHDLLTDANFSKQLVSDKTLQSAVAQLLTNPDKALDSLSSMLSDNGARDAALAVASKNQQVISALNKVGLSPKDLQQAGAAAPHLLNAITALAPNGAGYQTALNELKAAGGVAPDVLAQVSKAIYAKLPQSIQKQLGELNINADQMDQFAQALPDLVDAASAMANGNWHDAIDSLMAAGQAAPGLTQSAIVALGKEMPAKPALLKTLLSDPNVASQLASDKTLQQGIDDLINGDTLNGASVLLHDDGIRDAVLKDVSQDPTISNALSKLGLNPDDLVQAGAAAPHLLDAAVALSNNNWKDAIDDFSQAASVAPDISKKISAKLVQYIPSDMLSKLSKLSITTDDLKNAGAALPDLINAAQSLAAGKYGDAVTQLGDAAAQAPDLAQKTINALGKQLPAGLAQDLLTDSTFSKQLATDKTLQSAVAQMLNDPNKALDSLSSILNDGGARDAALAVASKNQQVISALSKVGLSPGDLQQAGTAAPHMLNAMVALASGGDYKTALNELKAAGDAAPAVLNKVATAIYAKLPTSIQNQLSKLHISKDQVGQFAQALPDLVDAATAIASGNWHGAIDSLMTAGETAPELAQTAIQALGNQLPTKLSLLKTLLTDPQVASQLASDQTLHQGIDNLIDGNTLQGASVLLHDDGIRDAVLKDVSQDPTVSNALSKLGLKPDDLVQAGDAAPHLLDAAVALSNNNWSDAIKDFGDAAGAAPDLVKKVGDQLVAHMPPAMVKELGSIGLTQTDLQEAGTALPDFIDAVTNASHGDYMAALKSLGAATQSAPDLVAKAVNYAASKLPDNPDTQLLKTMLTDKSLVTTLVSNPDLQHSLGQLLNGDFKDGIQGIANNQPVMSQVAAVLAKDPAVMNRLKPLGVTTADDIAQLGPALADAVDLADDIAKGTDIGATIQAFGKLAQALPSDARDKIISNIVDKFKLSPELSDLISGSLEAIANPDIAKALGDAIKAFGSGNPLTFIQAVANVGEKVCNEAPGLAVDFMDNVLTKLPGSVGKFFDNHDLNQDLVQSGSMGEVFDALEKMAGGHIGDALDDLGSAIGKLITEGKHYQLGPWHIDLGFYTQTIGPYDLPFGQQGVDAVGALISQFEDALPPSVKNFMEQKAASAVANAGLDSIPVVGPAYGIYQSGTALISDISNHKGGLTIGLDTANLVVNAADLIPALDGVTEPLRTLIGVGKAVDQTVQFIQNTSNFGQQFTGMPA